VRKTLALFLVALIMVSACSPEAEPEPEEVAIDNELRREMSELFGLLEFSQARTLFQDKMAKGLPTLKSY